VKVGEHSEDIGKDGRGILKWMFEEAGWKVFSCVRHLLYSEDYCLLRCDNAYFVTYAPTFRTNLLHSSSKKRSKFLYPEGGSNKYLYTMIQGAR
jgi:hypothetical protein